MRTAEDSLRLVPGLVLAQHGSEGKGHQYFFRGFDAIHGADLEIHVAGIPINEWSNVHAQGYLDLGFLIPELIDTVTVTKGPFRLDQGLFGMAGSVRFDIGIPKDDLGRSLSYTFGTTGRHRGVATWSSESSDFLAVEGVHDEGFGQRRRIDRATLTAAKKLGPVKLFAAAYHADFQLAGSARNDDFANRDRNFLAAYHDVGEGTSSRLMMSAQGDAALDGVDHTYTAFVSLRDLELFENFTGFLVDPVRGDWRDQRERSISAGLTNALRLPLTDSVAAHVETGVRAHVLSQQEDASDAQRRDTEPTRRLSATHVATHVATGLEFNPIDVFRVQAGVRADHIHINVDESISDSDGTGSLTRLSPRVTSRLDIMPQWALFAAYGRGLRPPEARAFTELEPARLGLTEEEASASEPQITASDSFEVGTRWQPGMLFGAQVAGFGTFIASESVFDHVSGANLALNPTRRIGVEAVVFSDPTDWLSLTADLTLVDARFSTSGRRVPHAPAVVGGARALVIKGGFRAGLRFLGITSRPLPQDATGGTYALLDATLGYHLDWIRFDLGLENLLFQNLKEGEYNHASLWDPGVHDRLPALHYVAGPPFNARLTVSLFF